VSGLPNAHREQCKKIIRPEAKSLSEKGSHRHSVLGINSSLSGRPRSASRHATRQPNCETAALPLKRFTNSPFVTIAATIAVTLSVAAAINALRLSACADSEICRWDERALAGGGDVKKLLEGLRSSPGSHGRPRHTRERMRLATCLTVQWGLPRGGPFPAPSAIATALNIVRNRTLADLYVRRDYTGDFRIRVQLKSGQRYVMTIKEEW
jgi:hypothetical protein